jgi:hypothetical protein
MAAMTVLDDEYATLWYHPEEKVVHHQIHEFLVPGVFEKLLSTGADLMEGHGARKWLSDDRANVVVSPEDLKWADDHWAPRVETPWRGSPRGDARPRRHVEEHASVVGHCLADHGVGEEAPAILRVVPLRGGPA